MPSLPPDETIRKLTERYGDKVHAARPPRGDPFAVVSREHLLPVLDFLKNEPSLRFDFLVDVTAVDHLLFPAVEIGERFAVVYVLWSMEHGHRLLLKTPVPESDPRAPSAVELWKSALWGEREVHDMFGIEFEGNPDMRRLLMPEDYPGFPLRKDYPLRGRGERDAFPQYDAPALR